MDPDPDPAIFVSDLQSVTTGLQKKPPAQQSTLQTRNSVIFPFLGTFRSAWIRIPDPDPLTHLNPDPPRIRIRNTDIRRRHPPFCTLNAKLTLISLCFLYSLRYLLLRSINHPHCLHILNLFLNCQKLTIVHDMTSENIEVGNNDFAKLQSRHLLKSINHPHVSVGRCGSTVEGRGSGEDL
jgi:hypothetical protein